MRPTLIIAAVAGFAALLTVAGQAQAQLNRTFVSGHGDNSNPCNLAAPCRSFAQAITQTNAGGEIAALDSAGYGPVTITKSVSIINDGAGEAAITASASDAIDISIGASDVVNLRGLTLMGGGAGNLGVLFNNLGTLNVQNCVIRGFAFDAMRLLPAGAATFNITDTVVSSAGPAFDLHPLGAGTVTAAFNRVQTSGSAGVFSFFIAGFSATGPLNVTIANSAIINNAGGIGAQGDLNKGPAQVMVSNTVISNNGTGVSSIGPNSTIYLAKNTIAGNTTTFELTTQFPDVLFSFGDNYIKGNGDDATVGAIPLVSTK